jgi:glycosyltransferase involved in cell wall biosynthesis
LTKVLQVIQPARFGGIERVVQALAIAQRARGHEVHVASVVGLGERDAPFHGPFRGSGVELHIIEIPIRAYLKERRGVTELCRLLQPDVVHTHGYRADVVDGGVPRHLGIPAVSTMHGLFADDLRVRLSLWVQIACLRRFDAVVAVSNPLAHDLRARGVPASLISVVPNAWNCTSPFLSRADARRALGIPDSALAAGWVGRLTRQKALEVAISAIGYLRDLPVTLSVIGDGEERGQMQALASAAGLADRILWHGVKSSAHQFMRAFDVFIISSLWEGAPIVLLEAMAAGTPVVTTAVGGVPDMVSDREALLVPAEDPRALAEAVRATLQDSRQASQRAVAALDRIHGEFGVSGWVDRYDSIYESLVRRRSKA